MDKNQLISAAARVYTIVRHSGIEMLIQARISQVPDHRIHWNASIELDTQIIPPLRKLQLSPPQPLFQFRHLFGNCLQQDYEDATER